MIINEDLLYRAETADSYERVKRVTMLSCSNGNQKKENFLWIAPLGINWFFSNEVDEKTNKKEDNRYFTCISESKTVFYNLWWFHLESSQ